MKISRIISRDIKYLDKLHLHGYISCQELRAGFPHNFPNYIMGEMLWNKETDYEVVLADYFRHMYGEDWEQVTEYLEQLSQYSSCDHFNAIGPRVAPDLKLRYQTAIYLAQGSLPLIEKNTQEKTGVVKAQWLQLGYHREYTEKLGKSLALLSEGRYQPAQLAWRDFLDFIRRNEENFQPNLDVYRVIEVAKNYAGFTI